MEIVGWTNGCFDILHPGHLHFLAYCKSLCDRLILGLNRDESVRQLKGDGRPINDFTFRESMLRGTRYVDDIREVWSEADLRMQIQTVRPSMIFKGEDYIGKPVVGQECAPIRYVPLLDGYSTTNEVKKRELA
jgi:D-beta-D-heptose 7-phosphate kinase/D-beta-D-heptose 1-phosphate adenosyltransferase